jgi:hypothetical protein
VPLAFLADENVEVEIVEALRHGRLLITNDRDFGERLLGSFLVIGERTMRLKRVPGS